MSKTYIFKVRKFQLNNLRRFRMVEEKRAGGGGGGGGKRVKLCFQSKDSPDCLKLTS